MKSLTTFDYIAIVLLVIGGLNWGLVGVFGFDLVAAIFGYMSAFSRVIYSIVGLCGVYVLVLTFMKK